MINPMYWYSKALAPRYVPPGTGTAAASGVAHGTEQQQNGGPDGGRGQSGNSHPTDLRAFDSIGDYFNDLDVQKNGRALMDMVMGVANPGMQAATGNGLFSGSNSIGPQIPSFGINDAVADEIAQAAQGGGPQGQPGGWDGSDAGREGAAVEAAAIDAAANGAGPQVLAKGGTVKGDRHHGVDDVMIAADGGEEVISARRAKELGPKFRREVHKKKLDRKALVAALRG